MKPTKPLIKICGLRRPADADIINDFPVSFVGFVFAKSKRQVDINTALEIKKRLRPDIKTVGVFTETTPEEVRKTAERVSLDVIQLHSDEDNNFCQHLRDMTIWKSLSIKDGNVLDRAAEYDVDGFLLDAYDKGLWGGTGKSFNWELAADFAKNHYTILAGGISAENINEAIETVRPHVVDLSSSVETDGFKDRRKIEELFKALERK